MINTIQIHYDYDETDGILPSGLPKGPAYCSVSCPHLNRVDYGVWAYCDLFDKHMERHDIGQPKREAYTPAPACRNHEMQGR